jgi:acid stress-induced BolA-like protein IbaG/YrbA
MNPDEIERLIEQGLKGAQARVVTDGQGHYEAVVVCAPRHQMVYGTLGDRVGRDIHALAVKTYTPDEWRARKD